MALGVRTTLLALSTLVACGRSAVEPPAPAPAHAAPSSCVATNTAPADPPPDYVLRVATSDLYVRRGKEIISAPAREVAVLRSYPRARTRGPLVDGRRMTLLTDKRVALRGEDVRVIHVVEVERAGEELWIMGPKPVVGEHVDGKLVTDPVPAWGAFTTGVYDGAVLKSPGLDTNFEVTTYRFDEPGVHRVQWRAGKHESNVLCIEVR